MSIFRFAWRLATYVILVALLCVEASNAFFALVPNWLLHLSEYDVETQLAAPAAVLALLIVSDLRYWRLARKTRRLSEQNMTARQKLLRALEEGSRLTSSHSDIQIREFGGILSEIRDGLGEASSKTKRPLN